MGRLVVQQYLSLNGELVFSVGIIVGLDQTGGILNAPTMTEEEIARSRRLRLRGRSVPQV